MTNVLLVDLNENDIRVGRNIVQICNHVKLLNVWKQSWYSAFFPKLGHGVIRPMSWLFSITNVGEAVAISLLKKMKLAVSGDGATFCGVGVLALPFRKLPWSVMRNENVWKTKCAEYEICFESGSMERSFGAEGRQQTRMMDERKLRSRQFLQLLRQVF